MMHEQSALVPSNYNNRKKESRKTNDSTFDRIYKYYYNSKTRIELTDEEEQIRVRWETAWFLLVRAQTNKQVADALERMFSIGKSVAYDDVDKAMKLFGDPSPGVKSAKRAIAESMILRFIAHAEKIGSLDMMDRFLQKYIEINGLKDKGGDAKLTDLLKTLRPTQINLTLGKEELEKKATDLHDILVKAMSNAKKNEGEG